MSAPVPSPEEALPQVIDRLWETVPLLWNQMRGNVRGIASERFAISVQQFRVLRHIRRGIRSACELACTTQASPPAISQCVDALVEKGLITRRQNMQDRRCIELELTSEGAAMLDAVFAENRRWMMQKLASLGTGELESVLRGMSALRSAFIEQTGAPQ
jgi:DNA-binding MarR family transcriptional regulator